MSTQKEAKVVCKICRDRYVLINTQSNSAVYVCVKCTFQEVKEIKSVV